MRHVKAIIIIISISMLLQVVGCQKKGDSRERELHVQDNNSKEEVPRIELINYVGELELPVNGATGYTAVAQKMYQKPDWKSENKTIVAGTGYTILQEQGEFWQVKMADEIGWILHKYNMINLPDVIPSIIYDDTNARASKMKSSNVEIPNITGQQLYQAFGENERLGRKQFIVPVLYSMSKVIYKAQKKAQAENNTLIIYEAFRPYDVQQKMVSEVEALAFKNSIVKQGVSKFPWSIDWFIARGISNHQQGYAIDVSLAKIERTSEKGVGKYRILETTMYTEYKMPTEMHELSTSAISLVRPVTSYNDQAWRYVETASTMNTEALTLKRYCTEAGLSPLASEWWHFNDLKSAEIIIPLHPDGKYRTEKSYSVAPQ